MIYSTASAYLDHNRSLVEGGSFDQPIAWQQGINVLENERDTYEKEYMDEQSKANKPKKGLK